MNDRPVDGQSRAVTEPAGETEGHVVVRGFYRRNPPVSSDLSVRKIQQTLAVPEKRVGCSALFLAFFDRGAIKSSLYRPQDALGFYAPKGEG